MQCGVQHAHCLAVLLSTIRSMRGLHVLQYVLVGPAVHSQRLQRYTAQTLEKSHYSVYSQEAGASLPVEGVCGRNSAPMSRHTNLAATVPTLHICQVG